MAQMKKPKVKLTGGDGNVFAVIGACVQALKKAGLVAQAKEMTARCFAAWSYNAVLIIVQEYVEVR